MTLFSLLKIVHYLRYNIKNDILKIYRTCNTFRRVVLVPTAGPKSLREIRHVVTLVLPTKTLIRT